MSAWRRLVEAASRVAAVARARLLLRDAVPAALLRRTENLDEFVDRAFLASARNLAVASAFLPAEARRAGAVAFLACRTLDAFEDLGPEPARAHLDLLSAAQYLAGRSNRPPHAGDLRPGNASDALEAILAERIPMVRAAIENLPVDRREEVAGLLARMSAAMAETIATRTAGAPVDRSRYGGSVLGEAVAYAVRLTGAEVSADLARAAGRILQLANDMRDERPTQMLSELALGVATDAPLVPRLLESLRYPARSGARAAVLYLTLTTTRFLLRQARIASHGPARWPFALAVAAAFSASSYRRTVRLLDRWIHRAPPLVLRGYTDSRLPSLHPSVLRPYERPRVRAFAGFVARLHPDRVAAESLATALWLCEQAGYFLRHVPEGPCVRALPARSLFLLAGDHLVGTAIQSIAPLGSPWIREAGEAMVRAAELGHANDGHSDPSGALMHCLSRIVTDAQGAADADRTVLGSVDVDLARALAALDRAVTRSASRKARVNVAAALHRTERLAETASEPVRRQILLRRRAAASIAARRE